MKIGMMSLWNAANGPSIHAEFIGREWIKREHSLVVFSAHKHPDFRPTQQENEDFVFRHFDVSEVFPRTKADSFDNFVDLKIKAVSINELYTYLHASDVLLIHKESSRYKAVISSTVCQTLGSGCPILFRDSNYVELHGNEIVKYRDLDDMELKLVDLFDGKFDVEKIKSYLRENNASRVADRFIQLFEKVREDRRNGSKRIW